MKVLILCTGNSCRSQMAEGFLRSLHPSWGIFSAGTNPEKEINPVAIEVMKEIGMDISSYFPKSTNRFLSDSFDFVITVCDNARKSCPVFTGEVKQRLHIGFEDPASATGSPEEILSMYRKIRYRIQEAFQHFPSKSKNHEKSKKRDQRPRQREIQPDCQPVERRE